METLDIKLDAAVEKANRLVELLREAKQIVDSLSGKEFFEKQQMDNFCEYLARELKSASNFQ